MAVPEHVKEIMEGFAKVDRFLDKSIPASDQSAGLHVAQRKHDLEGRQINPDAPLHPIMMNTRVVNQEPNHAPPSAPSFVKEGTVDDASDKT